MNQNVSQNQMLDDCMVEMARDLLNADLVSQFGGHDKSIIVESEFEVILTHLPLWKNESPLFMIGRMLDNHVMKSLVKQEDVIDNGEKGIVRCLIISRGLEEYFFCFDPTGQIRGYSKKLPRHLISRVCNAMNDIVRA